MGLAALAGDLEHHVGASPLLLVLDEAEIALCHVPHHPLARHPLGDLLGSAVDVLVAIGEYATQAVCVTGDLTGPPSAHVVDGGEYLLWRLVHCEAERQVLVFHDALRYSEFGL